MSQKLREISSEDWPKLRDLYAEHKDYASSYNTIKMFINWHRANPAVDVKIYTLDDSAWQEDGTFLAFTSNQILCNTLNTDLTRLICCFKSFDAGEVYVVGGFREKVLPAVEAYINAQVEEFAVSPTIWCTIEMEKIKNFDVSTPLGITIERLQTKHAVVINSFWPHSWPSAIKFVQNMISYNESVGAFDASGNLIGWCLVNPIGHVALLHVIDSHKRQGIGSLITRCLAKKLLHNNLEVLTSIVNENFKSRALFDKLGFKSVDNVYWAFKQLKE